MPFLPDWAPHIHPLLVHFPIGLLFAAAFFDLLSLVLKKDTLRLSSVLLYTLGTVAAAAAFFTGRQAADATEVPAAAVSVLTEHADWAEWTLWFFGIYTVLRLGLWFLRNKLPTTVATVFTLVGVGGLFLVWQTGERGAQMVFQHGVGVQAAQTAQQALREMELTQRAAEAEGSGPTKEEEGSWYWKPKSPSAWKERLLWVESTASQVATSLVDGGDRGTVLSLTPSDSLSMFVLFHAIPSVQADVMLNLSDFEGEVMLVHHVHDGQNYHFLSLSGETMRQGYVREGVVTVMDDKPLMKAGWQQLRAVGDKTHFRGYSDGVLVTHGHTEAAPSPGSVGLRLAGKGTVLLDYIDVQALR